ncbi:succinate dehydrogenase, hydrophobic membrane anchor protein [Altererythrobacter sp. KTW20L]|uniref:succinate dehydrogenase, hydrophobic membrane anchor protein n=1 Tax=Altererythrobacter sp. KTW20L TaxID=2942210 RepID=UPI0020BE7DC8|nr:succinate dehydrogenase, hydrophobic membrane anchor protein [Altererythrobacter sp. KTW20L]MCL6252092.1 succinate dehydrogenase, hydrophobic membrane anchor protein [Altererythrobacter sp. KTW20L]
MGNGTSIGKVRGLGSAKHGTHHWLLQRFTAVGNFLGGLFLVASFLLLPDASYATVTGYFSHPVAATLVALFLVSVFWHARLGLQVLIEDYVHTPGNHFAAIVVLNLFTFIGAGFGLFAIVRLALTATLGGAA